MNDENFDRNPDHMIKICHDYIDNSKLIEKCLKINRKNSKKSYEYRLKGNECYVRGLWNKCLYLYSQSLQYAPVSNDDSLPLAYGNRSAVNFQLERYELSILDIQMAIDNGYGNYKSETKLRNRQIECLLRLNRLDDARQISDMFGIEFSKPKIFDSTEKPIASSENEKIPEKIGLFSSKVCLSYDNHYGRYVRAGNNKSIESNELILIEHPYVHVLLPHFECKYCHHCCRQLSTIDQFECCSKCSIIAYCSNECRKNSWQQYHQYECSFLPFLWQFGIGHLVYCLMAKTDVDLILDIYQDSLNKSSKEIEQNLQPFLQPSSSTSKSTYHALFSLKTHQNQMNPVDIFFYRMTATLIIELLFRKNRYQTLKIKHLKQILIDVCFRHLCQTIFNSHTIMIPDSNDCSIPIATAFYPSLSLLNHSCDPNIQIIFKNGIECFIRSNRTIRSNEQIFNCYGINYRSADYKQRQQLLLDQYFFHCKCQICKNESKDFKL
ncbi:protein-lysine N-methyltransferase SMYD4-like [Dermatophagoides pteronyssinus]|uniref:protein-lysine N-methyltransferase SMYD4-like n=1 Tax=Dermatophagoides pteronyssinus TaxID=6956 RepID=UPI003F6751BB